MTDSPMARLGTGDSTTRGKFIAGRRRDMVQFIVEADEKAADHPQPQRCTGTALRHRSVGAAEPDARPRCAVVGRWHHHRRGQGNARAVEDGSPRVCRRPRRMGTALGGE
jgi:hypothetical protein